MFDLPTEFSGSNQTPIHPLVGISLAEFKPLLQSAYNLSEMLSKHWDHPTVYPMILKLLFTRGNITLIPREATQENEKDILNPQPEKEKKNQNEKKNMK